MITRCCVCKRQRIGSRWVKTPLEVDEEVSHTYCPECVKGPMAEIEELERLERERKVRKNMSVKHVGDAVFVDTDRLEDYPQIYPYVEFPSLEHASVGLCLTVGGAEDEEIASVEVSYETFTDPIAQLNDYSEALSAINDKYYFEECPYVELEREEQYALAINNLHDEVGAKWGGSGVYDFRDMTKVYDSVEEYELKEMEDWADTLIDQMFSGEDWESVAEKLSKEAEGEDTDDDTVGQEDEVEENEPTRKIMGSAARAITEFSESETEERTSKRRRYSDRDEEEYRASGERKPRRRPRLEESEE